MSKDKIVPKLRFPEFKYDGEWEETTLKEVCQMQVGKFINASNISEIKKDGMFPCYGGNGLRGYTKSYTHSSKYSLIGRQGALCGNVMLADGMFHATEHAIVVTPEERVDTVWLFYLLTRMNLNQYATGQAQPGLSVDNLEKLDIEIPNSENEQQKIADCLSSLYELVTAHSQKLEALKAHKKGLMQQLFPAEGETVPKLRFAEFRDNGEWEEKTLKAICQMQAGKFVSASEISEKKKENLFPCYGGNGLRGYTKSYTHTGNYSLIGRQGALCGNVMLTNGKFHATEHAIVVTPKEKVDTIWLFYLLIRMNLNQHATGQAQPGLSIDNLEKLDIRIPGSESEQQKIASCLFSLDELIVKQAEKIASLKVHKKGLMQQLFPMINEVKDEQSD